MPPLRVCAAVLTAVLGASALAPAAEPEKEPRSFEVPYRLTVPKHVLVRAKINGKGPYNFILDTGAPALIVATSVCEKLGVKADANRWGTFDRFEIEGGVVIPRAHVRIETPFQLEGMNGMGLAGVEVHGLIGYDILARYRMTIDFTSDKLVWTPLAKLPAPSVRLGGKGGGAGGLEMMGNVLKMLGEVLGRKPAPPTVLRGFLGLTLTEGGEFPVVSGVLEKGPSGRAGVRVGDRLTRVQGRTVTNGEDVTRWLTRVAPGEPLKLTVQRGEETREISLTLGEGI